MWVLGEQIENLSSASRVLHITSNLVLSRRCQDGNSEEMYKNAKRTCRACRAFVYDVVDMLISNNLHKKSTEVSIKTRSTPASLSFIGQVTKHTNVKWTIGPIGPILTLSWPLSSWLRFPNTSWLRLNCGLN